MKSQKWQNDFNVCCQGKSFSITVIQVYALTSNAEEAEVERFYEDLQDLLELTAPNYVLFIIWDGNAKVGSQERHGVTGKFDLGVQKKQKQNRTKANRILPRECTVHNKCSLQKTQERTLHMDITRWSILKSDGLYSLQPKMEKLYKVSKKKTGSWLWLRSCAPYCQIQTYIEKSRENH